MRVDQDVNLSYQEIFGHLVDVGVIKANNLGDFFDDVEVWLIGLDIDLQNVQKRLKVF